MILPLECWVLHNSKFNAYSIQNTTGKIVKNSGVISKKTRNLHAQTQTQIQANKASNTHSQNHKPLKYWIHWYHNIKYLDTNNPNKLLHQLFQSYRTVSVHSSIHHSTIRYNHILDTQQCKEQPTNHPHLPVPSCTNTCIHLLIHPTVPHSIHHASPHTLHKRECNHNNHHNHNNTSRNLNLHSNKIHIQIWHPRNIALHMGRWSPIPPHPSRNGHTRIHPV